MGRHKICPICTKQVLDKDDFEYKGKHYHEKCFTKFSKQETKEKVKEVKEKQQIEKIKQDIQKDTHIQNEVDITDKEILAKERVLNYLKQLLNISKLNEKIYKLLKDYFTIYKFSYEGMLIALKYFYEIQGNSVVEDCVGIIPYIYEEAQEYEKTKQLLVKQSEGLDMSKVVLQKVVKIKKYKEDLSKQLIDINELR